MQGFFRKWQLSPSQFLKKNTAAFIYWKGTFLQLHVQWSALNGFAFLTEDDFSIEDGRIQNSEELISRFGALLIQGQQLVEG